MTGNGGYRVKPSRNMSKLLETITRWLAGGARNVAPAAPVAGHSDIVPETEEGASVWRIGGTPYIGDQGALCVATAYSCVKLLSEAVACLPIEVSRLSSGVWVPETTSRLDYLLNVSPNIRESAFDLRRAMVTELLLEGNAYLLPVYENSVRGVIEELVLCSRGSVSMTPGGEIYTINDSVNGIYEERAAEDVIHVRNMPSAWDRLTGRSVLTYARETLSIASAGDRETRQRFETGGQVKGIVSNGKTTRGFGEYQDEQLEAAAVDIDDQFNRQRRGFVSVPGQVDVKNVSMSSADMEFLQTRKFTVRDICRFFRVPPSFVFDDTSNNYKSAENAQLDFINNALNPILRNIEIEIVRKLYGPEMTRRRRVRFDRMELYSCDLMTRARYQAQTIQNGTRTINEWRKLEGMPPVEGGDRVIMSANLRPIEELTNPQTSGNDE